MMLKRILTLRTSNSIPFLSTGILAASKVVSRSLSEQNLATEETWDLLSAVCLERHPIITKPMQDIEVKYQKMLQQIEFENSMVSDFEMQKRKQKVQKNELFEVGDITSNLIIQDLEDSWEEELAKFKFSSRTSDVEEDNAVISLKRKLDKNLILLVQQKVGNSSIWIPPQSIRKHKETMIEAANRALQELCGNDVRVKFYGSAPIGFYKYKYPRNIQDNGRSGAKIFYFLAKYINGCISHDVKHCWLDREELKKIIHPGVHKSLSKFLLPD